MVAGDEWVAMEVRVTPSDPVDRRSVFHRWVNGQLVEERLFSNVGEALRRIKPDLPGYLKAPDND